MKKKVAVLLTCHNRKEITIACLDSFYTTIKPDNFIFHIFLVDDGCIDGTSQAISLKYPEIFIIKGDGNLFWAGGMRLAWDEAMKNDNYYSFLLLNDDVVLSENSIINLIECDLNTSKKFGKRGIYVGSTMNSKGELTYGAEKLIRNDFIVRMKRLHPSNESVVCDFTNGNILLVSSDTVDKVGIFDKFYTHGTADYDYSRVVKKSGLPVILAPNILGFCENDHDVPWVKEKSTLSYRISYLKSPKGLAYNEYLYYIKKNFPLYFPVAFILLWLKTFFPFLWNWFKKLN
ncbi:MAG: glycosyltransferase family 2 protein [Chitinophagaceae bacterium]|nr:glycosyltransferase family 2 protein [Chitinophagaceae bacterium]